MPTLIAFDLDGVLYTSEPFIADAYREATELVNAQRPRSFARLPDAREILQHVGWPVQTILARLFPTADSEAVALLHEILLDVICNRVKARAGRLYDAVPDALGSLHEAGHLLAVASNGRRRYVEAVLTTYGLADLFVTPIAADQLGDKSALLREYADRHRVTPGHMVMVGDRASDVAAARVIGCHFIGCDYGHGHRQEIAGAGPLVSAFNEVPSAVAYLLHL